MSDPELARMMRPWNWYFGGLALILVAVNVLYWWPQ